MNRNKIINITLSVAIAHFIITSLIGHYIAVRIGTQMGQVVASGLTEASEQNAARSEDEAKRIYQDMQNKRIGIIEKWQIPAVIISLPAKPFIYSLLKELRRNQFSKVITREITLDQFKNQGLLIDYIENLLNSLSLGLLVYIALRITKGST